MDRDQKQMPVIVLMDKETSGDRTMIRQWFEDSRFDTLEASNVFEALEEISDFTVKSRPDVVLLDVDSCEKNLPLVANMAAINDLPVVTFSKSKAAGSGKYFQSELGQIASQLDKLIPQ